MGTEKCQCLIWGSHDVGMVIFTGHHERCQYRPRDKDVFREVITRLVKYIEPQVGKDGMKAAMSPEDREAYIKGRVLMGDIDAVLTQQNKLLGI